MAAHTPAESNYAQHVQPKRAQIHMTAHTVLYVYVCVCTHMLAFFRCMPLKCIYTQVINQDGVRERGGKREFSYESLSLYLRRGDNPPSSWFLAGLQVHCPMKKLQ